MTISASILDLLKADSVAARETARSAASLDLLSAPSTSRAATLDRVKYTWSRDSMGSRDSSRTCGCVINNFMNGIKVIRCGCQIKLY